QAAERERAFVEERPGGYGPQNPQRLCDDRVRGGESGARKDFPATGAHQSQRGMQLGGGVGGNPHGAPAGSGKAVAANVGFDQSDRVLLFHRGKSGPQCETLAGRGPRVALDSHGAAGSRKEIPQGKRLSGTGNSASQTESVVDIVAVAKIVVASARDDNGKRLYPREWNHEFIDLPIVKSKDQDTPTVEPGEVSGILLKAKGRYKALSALLAGTGLRIGEALAIR